MTSAHLFRHKAAAEQADGAAGGPHHPT